MVDLSFDGSEDMIRCEGCGAELPTFLDGCPYCSADEEEDLPDMDGHEAPCPECGALIYDDSERCAICGAWVSMKLDTSRGGRKIMTMAVIVLLVMSMIYWTLLRT